MTEAIINDFAELGAALKRIEESKQPKAEAPEPAKIDWPTMYGVYQAPDDFMGFGLAPGEKINIRRPGQPLIGGEIVSGPRHDGGNISFTVEFV